MLCPACGADNSSSARFCSDCGASLAPARPEHGAVGQTPPALPGATQTSSTLQTVATSASLPGWVREALTTGAWILLAVAVVATATLILAGLGGLLLGSGSSSSSSSTTSLTDYLAIWVQTLGLPLFGGVAVTAGAGNGGGRCSTTLPSRPPP